MASSSSAAPPSPRVLLVIPDQWHRALLRAEVRELGHDALGTPYLAGSLLYPAEDPDRGAVGLMVVDQRALTNVGKTLPPGVQELLPPTSHQADLEPRAVRADTETAAGPGILRP